MFSQTELEKTLALHEKSYRLFLWLNHALKEKSRPFSTIENIVSSVDAAKNWITANINHIPSEVRPEPGDIEPFAQQFVSYINTSFEVADARTVRNCNTCLICGFRKDLGKHLKVRSLGKNAKETARELKKIYLVKLGESLGIPIIDSDTEIFMTKNPDLEEAITIATYAHELFRRSQFASQGEAVLALWREMTEETRNKPRKFWQKKEKFKLTVQKIMDAEKKISAALRAL